MPSDEIVFSAHAMARLFERRFSPNEIARVIEDGKTIHEYPDDKPYPSRLVLGMIESRPVHVVVADTENHSIVVTVYEPDPELWDSTFTKRITR